MKMEKLVDMTQTDEWILARLATNQWQTVCDLNHSPLIYPEHVHREKLTRIHHVSKPYGTMAKADWLNCRMTLYDDTYCRVRVSPIKCERVCFACLGSMLFNVSLTSLWNIRFCSWEMILRHVIEMITCLQSWCERTEDQKRTALIFLFCRK